MELPTCKLFLGVPKIERKTFEEVSTSPHKKCSVVESSLSLSARTFNKLKWENKQKMIKGNVKCVLVRKEEIKVFQLISPKLGFPPFLRHL